MPTCRVTRYQIVGLVSASLTLLVAAGCGQKELQYRVTGPVEESPAAIGPLVIEATPIDTAELGKDHPFRWRGSTVAGFMLFDVKITNSGDRDLLYLSGHQDFPGMAPIRVGVRHFTDEAIGSLRQQGMGDLIGTDQLELTSVSHEKPTVTLEEGYRYEVLDQIEFQRRYIYLMTKEMRRAAGLAFIPYVGGFIASSKMRDAGEHQQERVMAAEQMVLRPGVVPANSTARGFLAFTWPPNLKPGGLTLRLPVQPGQAVSLRYNIVTVDRSQAPDQ